MRQAFKYNPPTLEFIITYCSETTGAWSIKKQLVSVQSIHHGASFRAVFHPTNRVLCMERWCIIGKSTAVQLQQLDCLKSDHKKNAVPTKAGQHDKIPNTTKNKHNKHFC